LPTVFIYSRIVQDDYGDDESCNDPSPIGRYAATRLLVHASAQPMRGNPFLAAIYRSAAMQGVPVLILL
jgi:hypothetical protein